MHNSSDQSKNYLFIVRAYNDVDHFTPLLDWLLQREEYRVAVYTSNPTLSSETNENLLYLKRRYGLEVNYLLSGLNLSAIGKTAMLLLLSLFDRTKELTLANWMRWFVDKIIVLLQKIITAEQKKLGGNWAKELLLVFKPGIVVFDWTYLDIYPNSHVAEFANDMQIPLVALPHGLNVWTNTDHTTKVGGNRQSAYAQFDYAISQGKLATRHLIAEGWPEEKIAEIGSICFSKQWLEKYPEIFRIRKIINRGNDGLKVVLFLSKLKYRANQKKIEEFISFLVQQPNLELLVKPHTRGMKMDFLKPMIDKWDIQVSYNASSFELSQWCDIGIVYASSIAFQILHDSKLLVCPVELDENRSIFEEYRVGCIVRDIYQMKALLNAFSKNKKNVFYSDVNVRRLFEEIVYAGKYGRNVIDDQAAFLDGLIEKCDLVKFESRSV